MGGFITETINNLMKEGERQMDYFMVHFSKWKALAAHGIAPMLWEDKYGWVPRFVAIEDFRIATDTEISFRNMSWFGVRVSYTPGELSRKAFSKVKSKWKWDTKAVATLLQNVDECNSVMAENNYNWDSEPEKFEELRKQNAGYWSGDAMPTINLWHFYHQDDKKKWHLKIVPDQTTANASPGNTDAFICKSDGAIADSWREIIHVNFGDLNNKTPLLVKSVRSLGFALFEPCYWTDFVRCRLLQHTLDQFNILLRMSDPVDKARAQIQVFQNLGVVKPGVTFVPSNERHQIDANLVEGMMAQTKQLQAEMSTSYTQSVNDGTAREQTAFETGVKVQQNNAMLSGIMFLANKFEKTASQEICRRYCLKNSDDPDVIAFQQAFKEEGYSSQWLDTSKWRIEINMPLGTGNPTMAMVEAQNCLQLRPMLDPDSQQAALHDAAVQMVGTRRAKQWVKLNKTVTSPAGMAAANAFPLMMLGLPPQIQEGLNPIQQIQTLLGLEGGYIAKVEQTTKIPNPTELAGLKNVAAYIAKLVTGMQGDEGNVALFKEFSKDLGQLTSELSKLEKAMNAQMAKQNNGAGIPAEAQAKIDAINATTQAKIAASTATTAQKLKAKELAGQQQRRQKDEQFRNDQERQDVHAVAEIGRTNAKAAAKPAAEE
jgi:hypothetical protein